MMMFTWIASSVSLQAQSDTSLNVEVLSTCVTGRHEQIHVNVRVLASIQNYRDSTGQLAPQSNLALTLAGHSHGISVGCMKDRLQSSRLLMPDRPILRSRSAKRPLRTSRAPSVPKDGSAGLSLWLREPHSTYQQCLGHT